MSDKRVSALAALDDETGRLLLDAVTAAWERLKASDRDPEVMGDALAIGADMLAGPRVEPMPRVAAAAVRMAVRDRVQSVKGRPDKGQRPAPESLERLVALVGDALAAMPDGRLTAADPDPASALAIRPADVTRTALTALAPADRERAGKWLAADREGKRGKRPALAVLADPMGDALTRAVVAWDPAGDPCGTAHPRTRRSDPRAIGGGWQETTDHGPEYRRVNGRSLTDAEWQAIGEPSPERLAAPERADGDTAPRTPDVRERPARARIVTAWRDVETWRPLTLTRPGYPAAYWDAGTTAGDALAPRPAAWVAVSLFDVEGHPRTGAPILRGSRAVEVVPVMGHVRPSLVKGQRAGEAAVQTWDASASRGVSAPSRRKRGSDGPTTLSAGARTRA